MAKIFSGIGYISNDIIHNQIDLPRILYFFFIGFLFVRGYSVSREDHERNLTTLAGRALEP